MKETKRETCLLLLVVAAFTVLYISLIFNVNIWTDEAFTIQITRFNSYKGIIEQTALDVHPPFYYFIVEFLVNIFGESLQVYKSISIAAMLGTMLLMAFPIRRLFGMKVSLLSILWLNAIPSVMEYGVQVRSYAWLIFFMTAAGICAYQAYQEDKKRDWILLTLSCMAVCYIHTFAMIAAVFLYVILLVGIIFRMKGVEKGRKKSWIVSFFLSGGCVAVSFIPWLFVLYHQTAERVDNYHYDPVTVKTVLNYFPEIFGESIPFMATMVGIVMILAFGVILMQKCTRDECIFISASFLIPILTCTVGVLVSVLLTPFFVSRYMACCLGLISIALAIALSKLKPTSSIFLGLFLLTLVAVSYKNNFDLEYRTAHTQEFLDYMAENSTSKDPILYNYEKFGFIYECYFDTDRLVFVNDVDYDHIDADTMWYMDSCVNFWINDEALAERGWTMQYMGTFDIEHNQFLLYKIFRP